MELFRGSFVIWLFYFWLFFGLKVISHNHMKLYHKLHLFKLKILCEEEIVRLLPVYLRQSIRSVSAPETKLENWIPPKSHECAA